MRIPDFSSARRRGQGGSAVIVLMVLLSILLLYVVSNARTLHLLSREVRLVEQRQVRRWATVRVAKPAAELAGSPAAGSH